MPRTAAHPAEPQPLPRPEYDIDPRRLVVLRDGPPRPRGRYVLYFCQVVKRAEWHPGLDYAIARAEELGLPVVVYEGLRNDYPHACWRHHRFILDGVAELAGRLEARGIAHHFYLQQKDADRVPALLVLAGEAALVVTDDYPVFVVPEHNARAAARLDCPLYAVDSAGLAPMRAFPQRATAAFSLRPRVARLLPALLALRDPHRTPTRDSLSLRLPAVPGLVRGTELPSDPDALDGLCAQCGVDLRVAPAPGTIGGRRAGLARLRSFVTRHLPRYAGGRNRADEDVTSNLSPYLHYGMLAVREIVDAATSARPAGLSDPDVAAFVEELVVRRELAHNFCLHTPNPQTLAALPEWAQDNLRRHAGDRRPVVYDLKTLDAAATYDPLWNAIHTELRETGEPHGYLRMLWGKKIIEWAPTYEDALRFMIHLNDKYAYDGRDANSYTNFLWCFGLHDRPFPRRPIFGVMRPMSSASTGRKAGAQGYQDRVRIAAAKIARARSAQAAAPAPGA